MPGGLLSRPLIEIAQALRVKEVTAQEMVEAAIDRHERFGERLRAYSLWAPEQARLTAQAADAAFALSVVAWSRGAASLDGNAGKVGLGHCSPVRDNRARSLVVTFRRMREMTHSDHTATDIPEAIRARLARPTIRLSGSVGDSMVANFFDQLLPVLDVEGSILVELYTDGGDAEIGRRLAEEVRLLRKPGDRDVWFLGKTLVASAGVTIMAAFPRERRWLTRDTALLIHGRRMVKDLHLEGPLGSCRRVLEEMIADIDHGLRLEEQGFAELIIGTGVDVEEIKSRAYGGWYLTAEEAFSKNIVAGLI